MTNQTIRSVSEFIEKIGVIGKAPHDLAVYRGHSKSKYKPQPSVFRSELKVERFESQILTDLMSFHPQEFQHKLTTFDKLAHAQHHGLPTRLLDVSLNSLAGLYFSVERHDRQNGQVIRFDVNENRIKSFDSDALSCICCLSRLKFEEQEEIRGYIKLERERKGQVRKIEYEEFNKLESVKRLVQFVRQEKPYFKNQVRPIDLWSSYLAMPMRNSRRINAQSGAFLVSGVRKGVYGSERISLERFTIPAKQKNYKIRF